MTELKKQQNPKEKKLISAQLKAIQLAKARGIDGQLTSACNTSLAERYENRILQESKVKQHNLEIIMRQTVQFCDESNASEIDPDWLSAFLNLAENISSAKMQKLWSKILAMEIANPGNFSVKTLNILKTLTQREAQVFQRACSLASQLNDDKGHKLIIGYNKPPTFSLRKIASNVRINLGQFKLPYSAILMLEDMGLIHKSELESGELHQDELILINNNGTKNQLQTKNKKIRLVYYRFTPAGNELASLIPEVPITEYTTELLKSFQQDFS